MNSAWVSKKTSVTWLREICTRYRGAEAYHYSEVPSPALTNEPFFHCRCNLRFKGKDYEEIGAGRTKKEAKRDGAQAMLNSMEGFAPKELSDMSYDRSKVNFDNANKDMDDKSNPISRLQELCIKIRHPQPIYRVDSEFGLPHERLFRIACQVGEHVQYSAEANKKTAKREVAKQMETYLKSLGIKITKSDVFSDDDDEIIENIKGAKNAFKKMSLAELSSGAGQVPFGTLGCPYKGVPGPDLDKLKDDPTFIPESPISFLRNIAKEQDFKVEYIDIEEKTLDDTFQCLVHLSLEPVAILKGEGSTIQLAKRDAALDAINFLRKMMIFLMEIGLRLGQNVKRGNVLLELLKEMNKLHLTK